MSITSAEQDTFESWLRKQDPRTRGASRAYQESVWRAELAATAAVEAEAAREVETADDTQAVLDAARQTFADLRSQVSATQAIASGTAMRMNDIEQELAAATSANNGKLDAAIAAYNRATAEVRRAIADLSANEVVSSEVVYDAGGRMTGRRDFRSDGKSRLTSIVRNDQGRPASTSQGEWA